VESLMKRAIKQYPAKIRLIIQKFAVHINKNKLSMDQVFRDLDYNQDGTVNPKEFDNYFLKNGLSDDLPKSSVERLFKYLDSNNDGTLSINELELIIKTGL
jgi:Ca2+-binding EF-hand superfamily protein